MSFVKRIVAGALFVLLTLFSCASVIVWARSYVSAEAVSASRRFERYTVLGADGRVLVAHGEIRFANDEVEQIWRSGLDTGAILVPDQNRWSFALIHDVSAVPFVDRSFMGFGAQKSEFEMARRRIRGVTWARTIIQMPWWFITAVTGAWPALRMWKLAHLRQLREERGLCRKCGFDLAGVYYSCPKCGQRLPLPGFQVERLGEPVEATSTPSTPAAVRPDPVRSRGSTELAKVSDRRESRAITNP